MPFLRNQTIAWNGSSYRVIAIWDDRVSLYPLDKTTATPDVCDREELAALYKSGEITDIPDPYAAVCLRRLPPDSPMMIRAQKNYELIKPVLEDPNCYFGKKARTAKIREIAAALHPDDPDGAMPTVRRQVNRLLSRYWQKGQMLNALIPEYGEKIKGRRKECRGKPGRKAVIGDGVPITAEIRKVFKAVIDKFVMRPDGMSLEKSYSHMVNAYKKKFGVEDMEHVPSRIQYRYFYYSEYNAQERAVRRNNKIRYNKDIRPLTGSTQDIASGIGAIYEIDATKADVFLVDQSGHEIGRPTLYVVADTFSGMIAGVHVSLEEAKYKVAADALYLTFADKTEQCKRYGIQLNGEEWPVHGLPMSIVADNAELLGGSIEILNKIYGISIANTASFRGDSKGTVERSIGMIQHELKAFIKAVPDKETLRKAGAVDNRPKASLTLEEYYSLVLKAAIIINRRLKNTVPNRWPALMPPTPLTIWNHSWDAGWINIRNVPDYKRLRIALLPNSPVSISRHGVSAKDTGIYYLCKELERQGYFERSGAERKNIGNMRICIDHADISTAWLFPDLNGRPDLYYECTLAPKSRYLQDMSMTEAKTYQKQAAETRSRYAPVEAGLKAGFYQEAQRTADAAERRRKDQNLSPKEKTERSREYRQDEILRREKETPGMHSNSDACYTQKADSAIFKAKPVSKYRYFPFDKMD